MSLDPVKFTIGVGDDDSAYPILIEIEDKEYFVNSFEDADRIVNDLNEQLSHDSGLCVCPFSSGPALITEHDAETIMTVLDTFVSFSEELEEWVQEGDEEDDEELAEYLEISGGSTSTH